MIAAKIAKRKEGERGKGKSCMNSGSFSESKPPTETDAATLLNVSKDSVQKAKRVRRKAVPEVQEAVEKGNLSLNAADAIAKQPKGRQKAELEKTKTKPKRPRKPKTKENGDTHTDVVIESNRNPVSYDIERFHELFDEASKRWDEFDRGLMIQVFTSFIELLRHAS
jgi:ATP-dependent DNA ligase